ncbi:MAG: prolipoprotein diacylglyceryl transferase [Aphanocapsa sp. GSE-SYN-MK-11-07L]|jgi:phosphatidylglycerol:prolipoprotein diacylglycerol transferase|nr:prolipoprotein diacylglyceryl transferase [Aphanocapsa sp. GSE-SYN-MK-11-07L]
MAPLTCLTLAESSLAFQFTSPGATFNLGPLTMHWYGLLIAAAVLIGLFLAQRLAQRRQVDPELMADLVIWLVLAAIPAARLYYVIFSWPYYSQHPEQIIQIWRGGIAIHGAILGGILATLIFSRLNRVSFWQLADLVAPSLILGQAIGRWGNFFNSEAFGAPTELPWKLYIPYDRRPAVSRDELYYHPTFLYESLWNLGVFAVLLFVFYKFPKIKRGSLFLLYAIAYSSGRLWIEGLRTDSLMLGPLKMAQMVSLLGIALGILGLVWLYPLRRKLPDVVSDQPVPNP